MTDAQLRSRWSPVHIGIDFDNTIIAYDDVFLAEARARGLVASDFGGGKQAVRDAIRRKPGGELAWQALQGYVYGAGVSLAALQPGVDEFFRFCRGAGYPVTIISHKTEFGHDDKTRVSLRGAALDWMTAKGFFHDNGFGLSRSRVVFAETRGAKLAEISRHRCTHFIDDLEEVLSDPAFPADVERILFARGGVPAGILPYAVCTTWDEIGQRLSTNLAPAGSPEEAAAHLTDGPIDRVARVGGGRNSRVYRVESGGRVFALKQYPRGAHDPRDRLATEIDALALMERNGFDSVPRPLGYDPRSRTALLEWIEGAPVTKVSTADIGSAVVFLNDLHKLSGNCEFPADRLASEACLRGSEIARQQEARLARLETLAEEGSLEDFLRNAFRPALEQRLAIAKAEMRAAGLGFGSILPQKKRSLVPSDFGFHNALRRQDGSLAFIDFEYFGWDDPVKLVADVLLHPGTPVAEPEKLRFRRAALEIYGEDRSFADRLSALLPLFALRWVLILLNEFVPERWEQRVLAGDSRSWQQAKADQLKRAALLLRESDEVNASVRYA